MTLLPRNDPMKCQHEHYKTDTAIPGRWGGNYFQSLVICSTLSVKNKKATSFLLKIDIFWCFMSTVNMCKEDIHARSCSPWSVRSCFLLSLPLGLSSLLLSALISDKSSKSSRKDFSWPTLSPLPSQDAND